MTSDPLFRSVRMILMRDWDPIGVENEPNAQDEYDQYAGIIVQMLQRNASPDALYSYLREVETNTIGLLGNRDRTRRAADLLSALRN